MNALRLIRNNRIVLKLAPKRWGKLAAPIYASDTDNKARACSVLRCFVMRDGEPVHACDLSGEEAADVAEWAK